MKRRDFLLGCASSAFFNFASCSKFQTWKENAPTKALRVAFCTDLHACLDRSVPEALLHAADEINSAQPELVISAGDLISEGLSLSSKEIAERWRVFLAFRERIAAPFFSAAGNHDLSYDSEDGRKAFKSALKLEKTWQVVEKKNYLFIFLDTVQLLGKDGQYQGEVPEEQLAWLETELAQRGNKRNLILVSHIPFLTSYYQAVYGPKKNIPATHIVENAAEVLKICSGHNLLAVLQGHLHVNERITWRRTDFITSGAICGNWWNGELEGTGPGFTMLDLSPEKVLISYTALDLM